MATPFNASIQRSWPLKNGVLLGVSPSSDPTFDVEFARASSSGVYVTIARVSPKGGGVPIMLTDNLPLTTGTFSYKARAVKAGWVEGDYTAAVSARPVSLPEIGPNITPLTGKGIGSPLFQTTATAVQYGSANTQAYFSKTMRILGTAWQPGSFVTSFDFNTGGGIRPSTGTGSTAYNYQLTVPLPPEAVVTGYSILYRRNTSNQKLRCTLYSVTTAGAGSSQGDIHNPPDAGGGIGTAYYTSTNTASFTVGNASNILMRLAMYTTAGAGNSVTLERVDLVYGVPNLNRTL